jgi:hypothetical protein
MLVPVQGGVESLQKRNRSIQMQEAALSTVTLPSVFIFNVSQRAFPGRVGAGKTYNIPACKPGEDYSDPIELKSLILSEIDLADGGNNLGVVMNPALSGNVKFGNEYKRVIGVANDIVGTDSASPAVGLYTTNLEWLGVFATANEVPTKQELETARAKLRQRMDLVYAQGAELVANGGKVPVEDRAIYNEAAEILGRAPFWGNLDHTLARCPECQENIIGGANFCKHCQQAIDPASVAARAKKREKEAAKLLREEEEEGKSA